MGGMGLRVGVYGGVGTRGRARAAARRAPRGWGDERCVARYVGLGIGEVYPQLAVDGTYVAPEEIEASDLDVAFVAYGHGDKDRGLAW